MAIRMRVLCRSRRTALCRRSDVVEEWTALAVAVLLCLVAPSAGGLVGRRAHGDARATALEQLAERHRVVAVVVKRPTATRPSSSSGPRHVFRAPVRWTEPGGRTRSAVARVPAGSRPGDMLNVWFDSRGRAVPPPVDEASVWQYGIGMGAAAAGATAALVLLAQRAVRQASVRRRLAEWERAWALTEPRWTRREV